MSIILIAFFGKSRNCCIEQYVKYVLLVAYLQVCYHKTVIEVEYAKSYVELFLCKTDLFSKYISKNNKAVYIDIYIFFLSLLGMVESSRHNWSGLDKQTDNQNLNEERILALQLCGWIKKGTDIDVGPFLNSLVQEGEWERAAAVALFNLDIRRAIQILNEGASSEKGIRSYSKIDAVHRIF